MPVSPKHVVKCPKCETTYKAKECPVCKAREKAYMKSLWGWIDRPVPDSFYTEKFTSKEQVQARWDEIPKEVKPLARAMIMLATKDAEMGHGGEEPYACLRFRCMLYELCEELKKKKADVGLPYYWFMDGVMTEPDWIVKITNGIVKWVCDAGNEICGIGERGECRFYKKEAGK